MAPFWDPPELKKQGFRVEGVAFSEESRGSKKHPQKWNLTNEEREAREKREPKASQATENTRREAHTSDGQHEERSTNNGEKN